MDETNAAFTGTAIGGICGLGAVVLCAFICPPASPVLATFVAGGAMVGGAAAGGAAALKTAEYINSKRKG